MAWLFILLAGLEEVISVIAMKYVDGFKHKKPIIVMSVGFVASFYLLSQAMQEIAIGVAYAAWSGIGTVGITLIGILRFKEKLNLLQLLFLGLIITGVIGLQLAS